MTALATPGQRARVMAEAKRLLLPFAAAVRARRNAEVQLLWAAMSDPQKAAVALMLAEAADPGKLRVVAEQYDDGSPCAA